MTECDAVDASYELARKTWCAYFVMIARLNKISRAPINVPARDGLMLAAVYLIALADANGRDGRLTETVRKHLLEERGVSSYTSIKARNEASKLSYEEQVRISGATER